MGDKEDVMKKISFILAASLLTAPAFANEQQLESFVEARLLEINQDNSAALKGYNILFADQSESEILADRLFQIALKQGDVKTALKAIERIEKLGPLPAQAHILRYSAALKDKDWVGASVSLRGLQDDPVFQFMAPIMQSWIETGKGNDGTALLQREDNSGLTNFYARDQIIYQYLYKEEYDKVRKDILSMRPFSDASARDLILKAGPVLYKNGQSNFGRALLDAQGSGAALSTLELLSKGKKLPDHIDAVSPQIAIARLYGRVSATLADQRLYDVSLFFARTATWLAPDDRATMLYLGASLAANDQKSAASELLSQLDASEPYHSLFSTENIRVLLDDNRNAEAVNIARAISDNNPSSQSLLLLLAQTYDSIEQYDKAAEAYQKLVKITPDDQKQRLSYFSLYWARALTKDGQWDEAKNILDEGLKLDIANPFLLNFYGYSLIERGEQLNRGFALIEEAYELQPSSPDISDSLGWSYFLQGDLEKAIPLLEKAAEGSKEDSEIKEHLGDAYWAAGRRIDARYTWRIASLIADDDDKKRLDHKAEFGLDVAFTQS